MRRLGTTIGLALLLGALGACTRDAAPPKPDHVVLIVVDTLRADRTTPYGHSRDTTPALARLAREGVLFENAVSQSSWTSPSMVSLMTGRYVAGERLTIPDGQPTLAEGFRRAGFETAAFVCNDILSEKTRFDRGFQRLDQLEPYSDDAPIVQWLESTKGKRTFTWIHLAEPHDVKTELGPGYGPPAAEDERFKKSPEELAPEHRAFLESFAEAHGLADLEPSAAHIRAQRGGYDDDVAHSDRRIETYLAALERAGVYDGTAIVIASDHGEGLWTREAYDTGWRHEEVTKGKRPPSLVNLLMPTHGNQAYRELVHVPLIVKAPGLGPRVVVKSWVENVDIAPTLFELCDVPAPAALPGKSLLALARDPGADPARRVFSMTRYVSSVIDARGMQLLLPTPRGACELGLATELYDLASDPMSRRNVAAERPEVVAELARVVEERLAIGLSGEDAPVDPEVQAVLAGLGYVGTNGKGVVETKPDLSATPTSELVAHVANDKLPCVARLDAAEALAGRELDDAQRAKLAEVAAATEWVAVRLAIRRALGE